MSQTIKLEESTRAVLDNFSTINSEMLFLKGRRQAVISLGNSLIAIAELDQEFDQEFGVKDLRGLLGAVSMFEDPEIEIEDKYLTIRQDRQELRYVFSDKATLTYPKKTGVPKVDPVAKATLSGETLKKVSKALAFLRVTNFAFVGEDGGLTFRATTPGNLSASVFKVELGETSERFTAVISPENMRLMSGVDYDLSITRKFVHLRGSNGKIEYVVALEQSSKFEE